MARARGGTGMAVAVVMFAILFVISTVIAIMLYTKIEEHKMATDEAQSTLDKFVFSNEVNETDVVAVLNTRGDKSAIRFMLEENSRLKNLINGKPTASYTALVESVAQALELRPPNESSVDKTPVELPVLTEEIVTLRAAITQEQDVTTRLTREGADERKRRVAVQGEKALEKQAFDQGVSQLQAELQTKQGQIDTFRGQVAQQTQALQDRITELQNIRQQEVNDLRSKVEQKDDEIQIHKRRIAEILKDVGPAKAEAIDPSLQPDGEIISLLPEENLVFINRGRQDHVLLGMTFEVFSRKTGVIKDEAGLLRGKGSIEVVSISENSATCRVTRVSRGQQIIEGDLVANLVYDPNFTFKFYVYGDYDLDNVGAPSLTDKQRVETMVSEWGGELVPKLSYDTDFLVLGREPELPKPPADNLDPVEIQRYEANRKKYETYQSLVGEARALRIPILNQNRFLVLVGYYQR